MKKVLHITFDMRIGGTEQVIKNIIEGADINKFEHSIFCIESPIGPFGDILSDSGITIHSKSRRHGFDFQLIKSIRRYISRHKIDILHCHQYTPWVYGTMAAVCTKTKVIFTEHGRFHPDNSTWKRKLINPVLNLCTDQVTAISKATKQALIEYENISEKSIQVIYNGIAPLNIIQDKVEQLRLELSIPESHTVLGTISRFDPIKNHMMLLKAFSLVLEKQPNTTLIIVGDGDERENIEAKIKELNLSNDVILTGYQTEPKNYLALMDIYLLPSFSEGTSMTLLEAMSLGKPCVVTDVGGNSEVIIDSESGFVSPNDDEISFYQNIIKTVKSISIENQLGEASKNRFYGYFSEQTMNQQYQVLYQQMTSGADNPHLIQQNMDQK